MKKISIQGRMKNLELLGRLFLALWFIATVVPSVDAENCNSLCVHPHMRQTVSGKCKCVVGWTGPDAFYIEGNHVLADYCNKSCHYTSVVKNSKCAAYAQPTTTTTTTAPSPPSSFMCKCLVIYCKLCTNHTISKYAKLV